VVPQPRRQTGTQARPRANAPAQESGRLGRGCRPGLGLARQAVRGRLNGDGKLDLLVGDLCGSFSERPQQTPQEIAEEKKANDRLPNCAEVDSRRFSNFAPQTARREESARARAERLASRDELRGLLQRYRDEIALVREIQSRYLPMSQSHGFHLAIPPDAVVPAGEDIHGRSCLFCVW